VISAEPRGRTRLGILALPLTGLLYAMGLVLRGSPVADARSAGFSAADFAATTSTASYQAGWIVLIAGTVLLVFGYLALYTQLTSGPPAPSALPPMILTVGGLTLSVGVFGAFALVYPAIAARHAAGDTGMADLLTAVTGDAFMSYSSVGGLLYLAGTIWFALTIWRSAPPYRWAGTLLPVYYLLLLAPVFGLDATLAYVLEFLGVGVLTAAGVLLTAQARGTGQRLDSAGPDRVATRPAEPERDLA